MKITTTYINNENETIYKGFYEDGTEFELTMVETRGEYCGYVLEILSKIDRNKITKEQEKWVDRCALNELTTWFFRTHGEAGPYNIKDVIINSLDAIQEEQYNKYFKTEEN